MAESTIQRDIQLTASREGAVTFRNNVGLAWTGDSRRISEPGVVRVNPGDVVVRNARPLHAGLVKGSSDLIGWNSLTITPEMVGRKVAVFLAIEAKDKGQVTPEQANFITQVKAAGGIAGVARGPLDVLTLLKG